MLGSTTEAFVLRRSVQPGKHHELHCLLRRNNQRTDGYAIPKYTTLTN